ncbi:MAG: tol-pal system protein YbgF [Alphaproteobacteria bacterium]
MTQPTSNSANERGRVIDRSHSPIFLRWLGGLGLAVLVLWGPAAVTVQPAAAQSGGELLALLERIERLERELLAMRTVMGAQVDGVAQNGAVAGPADATQDPAQNGEGAGPAGGPRGLLPGGRASSVTIGDPALARVLVRVDQLESELTRMTGELERLQYRYERLNASINQLAQAGFPAAGMADGAGADRQGALASGQPQTLAGDPSAPAGQPSGPQNGSPMAPAGQPGQIGADGLPALMGDVRLDYKTALDLLYKGEFAVAEAAFRRFVESYPDSDFLGEAYYWIGESLFVRDLYKQASVSYLQSARDYPKNTKAADSLLKLAFTFKALGEGDQACKALKQIVDNYPNASEPIKRSVRKARSDFLCR